MTRSYTIGEFVAKYPKGNLRREDFMMLIGLKDFNDFAPGFDLQERARDLASGKQSIKKAQNNIYSRNHGLIRADLADYTVLGTMSLFKELQEKNPRMISRLSPEVMDRSIKEEGEYKTARLVSSKEIRLSNHDRMRFVREECTGLWASESSTAWYLEIVGNKEYLANQILVAGYTDIHGG